MVAAAAVLAAGPFGTPAEAASRIVDRTLVCRVTGVGFPDPARFLDVRVWPRLGDRAPGVQVANLHSGADGLSVGLMSGHGVGNRPG